MIALTPIQLFDMGWGPRMIPVAPLGAEISPYSDLKPESLGRAPGYLTDSGWAGFDWKNPSRRCNDYATAKRWQEEWGASVGFVTGDGYVVVDNDQGEEFSKILAKLCLDTGIVPLRRFVASPKHKRDALLFRVLNFIGDGAAVTSQNITFRNGTRIGKVQILAGSGQQLVISGIHWSTKNPYVWNREVKSLEEIPILSEDGFSGFIRKFVEELESAGWKPDGRVSVSPAPGLVSAQAPGAPQVATSISPEELADTRALLAMIPNREVPKGETPTSVDMWLDDYEHWRDVAYALSAHLGATAHSPEAETLWNEWSDGRHQTQNPWRSVIRQVPKFGSIKLVEIIRSLGALIPADFPPVDPNDPIFKVQPTPEWDKLRQRWAFFIPKGSFLDMTTGEVAPRKAFSDLYADRSKILTRELRPSQKKNASVADLFTEQPEKLIVSNLTYDPGAPRFVPTQGFPLFNKWRRPNVQLSPPSAKDVQLWLDHVEFVMGSAVERDRFVKWCAFVAQRPELKPNWHYLVMSIPGVGKDTMLAPLKAAVGIDNSQEVLVRQSNDTFNDALECKLLIIGEVHQPKWTAHEAYNNLKSILARPPETYSINPKYIPRYRIPNRIAVVMFSNEENPIKLGRQDRRIHVVNRRDALPKSLDYYKTLWGWLNSGGTERTASYLCALPLSDAEIGEFAGGVSPASDGKTALEDMNVDPGLAVLEDLIRDARNGIGAFAALLTTADQLSDHIGLKVRKPSPRAVSSWLMDMKHQKKGVSPVRIDPKNPNACGVVFAKGVGARLWALTDRDWSAFTSAEILAMWQGKPVPRSASILAFPTKEEEKI